MHGPLPLRDVQCIVVFGVKRDRAQGVRILAIDHEGFHNVLAEPDHATPTDGSKSRVAEVLGLEHDADIRREIKSLAVGQRQELIVVQHTSKHIEDDVRV